MYEIILQEYAIRALAASAMVGILCGVLGCFLVLRNMSLIGDALSHAILPGVVVGFILLGYNVLGFFAGAVIAGLVAALFITLIQRNVKTREDAAIGIVFTTMFALGVMGISWITRKQGVHLDLKDFLFGNILGISNQDLWLTFLVLCFTLLCVIAYYRFFFITTFGSVVATTLGISSGTIHYFLMLLLSFAVVASLQSVGVILVVAMLITPASTAYLLTQNLKIMLVLAALVGLLSAVCGLLFAIYVQTTPGPAMTLAATLFYLLAVLFAPQKGLVIKTYKRLKARHKINHEDVLKLAVKLHEQGKLSVQALQAESNFSPPYLRLLLRNLCKTGLFEKSDNASIRLTTKGLAKGLDLIRAHRLWETYLSEVVGMDKAHLHPSAEHYEHHLQSHHIESLNEKLGFPLLDPHGSAIPQNIDSELLLSELPLQQQAVILLYQLNPDIIARLWQLGLSPNKPFHVQQKTKEFIQVRAQQDEVLIDGLLAEQVKVMIVL